MPEPLIEAVKCHLRITILEVLRVLFPPTFIELGRRHAFVSLKVTQAPDTFLVVLSVDLLLNLAQIFSAFSFQRVRDVCIADLGLSPMDGLSDLTDGYQVTVENFMTELKQLPGSP